MGTELEEPGSSPEAVAELEPTAPRSSRARRRMLVSASVAIVVAGAAFAVPAALQSARHGGKRRTHDPVTTPSTGKRRPDTIEQARVAHIIAAAVGATTATGSYHVEYTTTETPSKTTPPTTSCEFVTRGVRSEKFGGANQPPTPSTGVARYCMSAPIHNVTITGNATVNVSPFAMRTVSNVSNLGDVTVIVGPNAVWEFGGADYGRNGTNGGPGQPLAGFASLVEGTLGPREGALAMTSLASPNGYLNITQAAISDGEQVGTGTVDGVPVKKYRITTDPAQLVSEGGITPDETAAINAALVVLRGEGYSGNTEVVSVDDAGLIRETWSRATFRDGGVVEAHDVFSQFGCAGTVTLPDQPAPPSAGTTGPCVTPHATDTTQGTVPPSAVSATSTSSELPTTTAPSTTSVAPTTTVPPTSAPAATTTTS